MLERQGLIVDPWEAPRSKADRRPRRRIRDADTGEPLGFVRRGEGRPRWLAWLLPAVLEVFETEDEAQLCSLRKLGWGRGWRVFDAEDKLVGTIRRDTIFDGLDACVAVRQRGPERNTGQFRTGSKLIVARFARTERGIELSFLPISEGDPFLRMALLGAVLTDTD